MIKFKAFCKRTKRMGEVIQLSLTGEGILGGQVDFDGELFEQLFVDEAEWLRFTGLKDKNGVEIFEGDIVRIDWNDTRYPPVVGVVEWDVEEATFRFGAGDPSEVNWSHEVIGNVHQHPELLEQ